MRLDQLCSDCRAFRVSKERGLINLVDQLGINMVTALWDVHPTNDATMLPGFYTRISVSKYKSINEHNFTWCSGGLCMEESVQLGRVSVWRANSQCSFFWQAEKSTGLRRVLSLVEDSLDMLRCVMYETALGVDNHISLNTMARLYFGRISKNGKSQDTEPKSSNKNTVWEDREDIVPKDWMDVTIQTQKIVYLEDLGCQIQACQ